MQSLQLGCTFTNNLSWVLFKDCDPVTQYQVSASQLWDLTSTEAASPLWPFLPSYGAKAQMLTLTSSRLQNQYHVDDSYSLPWFPAWDTASAPSGLELLYADPEETPLKRFHLSDADLFLTIADFSVPAD